VPPLPIAPVLFDGVVLPFDLPPQAAVAIDNSETSTSFFIVIVIILIILRWG
jgi:hypothetical protein